VRTRTIRCFSIPALVWAETCWNRIRKSLIGGFGLTTSLAHASARTAVGQKAMNTHHRLLRPTPTTITANVPTRAAAARSTRTADEIDSLAVGSLLGALLASQLSGSLPSFHLVEIAYTGELGVGADSLQDSRPHALFETVLVKHQTGSHLFVSAAASTSGTLIGVGLFGSRVAGTNGFVIFKMS
jgi:hypothetical protein